MTQDGGQGNGLGFRYSVPQIPFSASLFFFGPGLLPSERPATRFLRVADESGGAKQKKVCRGGLPL